MYSRVTRPTVPVEIVLLAPCFDDLLSITHVGKQPEVETFSPQFIVETLHKAVLPWAARTDIEDLAVRFPVSSLGETLASVALPDGNKDMYIQQSKFWTQFAADVPEAEATLMAVTQRPITEGGLTDPSTGEVRDRHDSHPASEGRQYLVSLPDLSTPVKSILSSAC